MVALICLFPLQEIFMKTLRWDVPLCAFTDKNFLQEDRSCSIINKERVTRVRAAQAVLFSCLLYIREKRGHQKEQ